MNLQAYIDSKKVKKVGADILERWQSRVVKRGLQNQGAEGARIYLRDYSGAKMAAPKALGFAQQAINMGYPEFAKVFYMKAAGLEGIAIEGDGSFIAQTGPISPSAAPAIGAMTDVFPPDMQPGAFAPMQPVDAVNLRGYYVISDQYWGQRKVDGNKLIIFVSPEWRYYQTRQMRCIESPNYDWDAALRELALKEGCFILEGEITYLDCRGGEHRTGAQAATFNLEAGHGEEQPEQVYYIFSCLYHEEHVMFAQRERVEMGEYLGRMLNQTCPSLRFLETARTATEKEALCLNNLTDGREGEVWFQKDLPLFHGKPTGDVYVRTKYLNEYEAWVTGFTPTTAAGYAFGAMSIESLEGVSLGNVGTGFTLNERAELWDRFKREGKFKVQIVSQGFTEGGQAWHARYAGMVE